MAENVFSGLSGTAFSTVNIIIFVIIGIVALGIVVVFIFMYNKWKKFQEFRCVIWRVDSIGRITEKYDSAGIFMDHKTHNKRFFMKNSNVGLDPDNVPDVFSIKGKRVVYLLQTGLKNFHFIKANVEFPKVTLTVGEEDVNWSINAYERSKSMWLTSKLLQWLPFIILAFVCIIILIIFIYFFKNFDVLRQVAVAFQEAATEYAKSRMNTTILP